MKSCLFPFLFMRLWNYVFGIRRLSLRLSHIIFTEPAGSATGLPVKSKTFENALQHDRA